MTQQECIDRLELFKTFEQNWDGYNGYPLDAQVYINTKELLNSLTDEDLQRYVLFPSPNATTSLELCHDKTHIGAFSIGKDGFSYAFMNVDTGEKFLGKEDFSIEKFKKVLQQANELLFKEQQKGG